MTLYFETQHLTDIIAEVILREDAIPLAIEDFPLLIKHVVIFEQMLTGIEIGPLNPSLGLLDRPIDNIMRNRHGIVDVEPLHDISDLRATKEAHQFVFQGQEELGRARVTLTGGTAT
jgi:hypothetical protein